MAIQFLESNARVYDKIKPCSFRQRLALVGHAKQNQHIAIFWGA